MNLKRFRRAALALALGGVMLTVLTGCAGLGVGEEEFACTGMPGSVYCHSARDVYEKTNEGVVPSPVGKKDGSYNEECEDCVRAEDVNPALAVEEDENSRFAVGAGAGRSSSASDSDFVRVVDRKTGEEKVIRRKTLEVRDDEVINNYVAPRLPSEPVPVRTPSQVMRIWIAPYVDTAGDLVAPGYVYTEIEPRRWIYPNDDQWGSGGPGSRAYSPLQGVKPGSKARAPKRAENSLEKFRQAQMARQQQ